MRLRMVDDCVDGGIFINVRLQVSSSSSSSSNETTNLFVQLSQRTLNQLLETAVKNITTTSSAGKATDIHPTADCYHHHYHDGDQTTTNPRFWQLKDDSSSSRPSFLPLELCLPDGTIHYVSFNGGLFYVDKPDNDDDGQNVDGDSWLRIPESLLLTVDSISSDGDNSHQNNTTFPLTAKVRILSSIHYVTQVHLDPWTIEDWDLLQVHADLLEGGGFLKSVSVIYRHQVLKLNIPVYRNQRWMSDVISLIVQDLSCSSSVTGGHHKKSSVWPCLDEPSTKDEKADTKTLHDSMTTTYGLLRSDTEVIIAPKTRTPNEDGTIVDPHLWSARLQVIPSLQDIGQQVLIDLEEVSPLLRPVQNVPVGCIILHPHSCPWSATSSNRPKWVELVRLEESKNESDAEITVARILFSEEIPELCVVLHPWLRWTIGAALLWDHVVVRPSVPPTLLSVDEVIFRPVQFEFNPQPERSWLAMKKRRYNPLLSLSDTDNLFSDGYVAVGTCIVLPVDRRTGRTTDVFRLTPKDNREKPGYRHHFIVETRNWEDRGLVAKLISGLLEKEVIVIPSTDKLQTNVRLPILTTIFNAAASILKTLRHNDHCICILYGASGTGKTEVMSLVGAAAGADHNRAMLYLDCMELLQRTKTLSEILSELDNIFRLAATTTKSCLIVFDDLDRIAPNLVSGNEGDPSSRAHGANPAAIDQSKVVADRILQLHRAANTANNSVAIVATCASDTSLNVSLCSDDIAVGMSMPDFKNRLNLFSHFLQGGKLSAIPLADLSVTNFGQPTEGFRPRDLEKLAARTKHLLELNETGSQNYQTVRDAVIESLRVYVPLSHIGLERPSSDIGLSWTEIGGLFSVKMKLESMLLNPVKYRAIYQQAKIRLPRGILLLGPTGCGKSCVVPALAKVCQFPLISCKGPEVLDKYIGASEAKIRELFQRAAAVAPSILFLDELDALAPRRGSDHTGVTDRVVNQLLTFLDGVEDTSGAPVYVIAASSRPDKIDPALLRPGRLEQHLYVGPPETEREWIDLLQRMVQGWKLSNRCRDLISSEAGGRDLLRVTKEHPTLCPADFKAALDTAQLNAVHRTLRDHNPEDVDHAEIEMEDLRPAFLTLRPCLSPGDASSLKCIYDRYRSDREMNKRPSSLNQEQLKTTLR